MSTDESGSAEGEVEFGFAGRSDLGCLQILAMQVFLETYATSGIRPAIAREVHERLSLAALATDLFASGTRVLVARRGEHLLAFAQLALDAAHPLVRAPAAELGRLYVQSPFLRRGIGAALLSRAEALARDEGRAALWLTAYAGNGRALAFYASQGYADIGQTAYLFENESHPNRLLVKGLGSAQ